MLNPDQTTTTAAAAAKPLNRWRRGGGTGRASAVMRWDSGISGTAHLHEQSFVVSSGAIKKNRALSLLRLINTPWSASPRSRQFPYRLWVPHISLAPEG